MRVATSYFAFWFYLGILLCLSCLQLHADDRDVRRLSIKELSPQLVDQEVTIIFRSLGTDGISQASEEGQIPVFSLEPEQLDHGKNLMVWIGGDLAELVDRFGFGRGVPTIPSGTIIEVTGKFRYSKNRDNVEHYFLQVDDWKRFRILSYPTIKKGNALPIGPRNSKKR